MDKFESYQDILQLMKAGQAFVVPAEALIEEMGTETSELTEVLEASFKAAGQAAAVSPIQNGKPRMMKVTAWMAHADIFNRNQHGFKKEDIDEVMEGNLFAPPYLGMIDFNHEFEAHGAWYSAKLAFDSRPHVQAWGIMVEGAVWAWRYQELANIMLANMQRNGFIDVSMVCIPADVERGTDKKGNDGLWLRKPTFFTVSLLDVSPADKHANGIVSEDDGSTVESRESDLLNVVESNLQIAATWKLDPSKIKVANQEDVMDLDQIVNRLKDVFAAELTVETTEIKALLTQITDELTRVQAEATEKDQTIADLTAAKIAAEGKLADVEMALSVATESLGDLTVKVTELEAFKAEKDSEANAAAKNALTETRLAQLNEDVRAKVEEMPEAERAVTIARWVEASEDEWTTTVAMLNGLSNTKGSRKSYLARSEKEGRLSSTSDAGADGEYRVSKYIKR